MKQVTVRLIDGKEYTFKVAGDESIVPGNKGAAYIADDGTMYGFMDNQISATIVKECILCSCCNKYVLPDITTISYDDNQTIKKSCPYCKYTAVVEEIKSHAK